MHAFERKAQHRRTKMKSTPAELEYYREYRKRPEVREANRIPQKDEQP